MQKIEIKNLGIVIHSGEMVGIIGSNGCGKTTLLKKIIGRENNSDIYIDDKNIKEYDIDYKKKNIVSVFNDNVFQTSKPKFELKFYLTLIKSNEENQKIIDYFIEYFDIENILDDYFEDLSIENRLYIKILSLLIVNPSIICIDDILSYLDKKKKSKIVNYIKERDITLLNVTSDMDELLLFDKLLFLNKGKVLAYGDTMQILDNEKLFKDYGLKLPFIYDINNLLMSYELIKEKHLVSKELVDLLWK